MPTAPPPKIRCRKLGETDIAAVADLLTEGFPDRPRSYWLRGLGRLTGRSLPPDCPRYGFVLENDGELVGVILLLFTSCGDGRATWLRCNVSSWYVKPTFRGYASFLIASACKNRAVTYTNISPAKNTWASVEAQGFKLYCDGLFFALAALGRPVPNVRVEAIGATSDVRNLPDGDLLLAHAGCGCISVVCHAPDGSFPFVFLPFRMRQGRIPLPCVHLVYCRDVADFVRFAGPLGRFLLRRGMPVVLVDARGPIAGLLGTYSNARGRKYFKGPNEPRLGDLAYSELVLFGP